MKPEEIYKQWASTPLGRRHIELFNSTQKIQNLTKLTLEYVKIQVKKETRGKV